jgi:beta-glucosidase
MSKLIVTTTVRNSGKYPGQEVVQLYIRDRVGSVSRPVKELKAFRKISLAPGAEEKVTFVITPEDLKFYDNNLKYDWEAGAFDIMTGGNSRDVQTVTVNWSK